MNQLPLLVIFLLLLAVLLRLDFVYYIIYVVGGIWLLSRWATPRSLQSLQVERRFTDHAFLGETAGVSMSLKNRSWLPLPWLRVSETLPLALSPPSAQLRRVLSLRPREEAELRYELRCLRRGYYPIGPLRLNTGDLFGFSDVLGREQASEHITVYPRIIPLAALRFPSRLPFGSLASSQRIFEDPARLRGVRDYQAGDSLRRINWKASAHRQSLLVKQYSPAISLETLILLNLNGSEYLWRNRIGSSEWAIVVAASIASYLESARQAVGLATNGVDPIKEAAGLPAGQLQPDAIPARPGRHHLMKLLEVLARVELAGEGEDFATWAQRSAASLSWGATVIAITPNGDEPACHALHGLVRAGLNVVLLVIEPYGQFGVVRERARRLGFVAHLVASERDLTGLQAHRPGRGRLPA